ncbi:hypothetical protein [Aminobacter sp. NyZ550]|uniref:hypothetical protein n=1 Tax=Aminobacter sp. NyZ550 TaxID=2979870 RepID=UPI003FA488AE
MIAEARGGATFGKRLAGLRVTSVNDTKQRRLPIARAVNRTAVLAPALALLLYSSFSFGLTLNQATGLRLSGQGAVSALGRSCPWFGWAFCVRLFSRAVSHFTTGSLAQLY